MKKSVIFIVAAMLVTVGIIGVINNNSLSIAKQSQPDDSNYNNVLITLENSNIINLEKSKANEKEIKVVLENNNLYAVCVKVYCESSLFHAGHGGMCTPSKTLTENILSICLNANEKSQTWISISTTEEIRETDYEAKIIVNSDSGKSIREIPLEIVVR